MRVRNQHNNSTPHPPERRGSRRAANCSWCISFALLVAFSLRAAIAAEPMTVVPVDGPSFDAPLNAISPDWQLSLGETITMPATDLVRYGAPAEIHRGPVVLTTRGDRCVLMPTGFDGRSLTAESAMFGTATLARPLLAGIVFELSGDRQARTRSIATAIEVLPTDRLLLRNGDRIDGVIAAIDRDTVTIRSDLGTLPIPTSRIATVTFSRRPVDQSPPTFQAGEVPPLGAWIGLVDGSRLLADRVEMNDTWLTLTALGGQTLKTFADDLCWLRPIHTPGSPESPVALSSHRPIAYRQVPFVGNPSIPYQLDRNVGGGPLRVAGRIYEEGIGVTSASQLTYALDGKYRRLDAQVAIDDAAGRSGSVRFYVFVDGRQAAATKIIRGGDAPVPITVDLTDAQRLDLVVDYGDQADRQDIADWLDPRLKKAKP